MLIVLVIGFLVGVLVILAAEALGVYYIIKWLNQKTQRNETKLALQSQESFRELDPNQSLYFAYNKQGIVWFLESEKISRNFLENVPNGQKKKKKFLEVSPVKKQAQIKDQKLLLTESDGSRTAIELKGCVVEAVSASSTSSRKWAKRFPIKLESKTSILYKGSKTLYIYLETSWEKESWCKALRLASSDQKERFDWFSKLQEEFHSYLTTLNAGYPLFMKPSTGYSSDSGDHTNKPEGTSSKFRLLLKKIAKKTARVGLENKSSFSSLSGRAERRASEKTRPIQETISETDSPKAAPPVKRSKSEENMDQQSLSTFSSCGSQSHISVTPDADPDDKFGNDEGTLCWNLLISRLFFDVKGNEEIKRSIQSRVQRTLSSTRTPSYIGEVICTGIELGNLPPYVHAMRILPMDINEAWAFEVDIEYSGGAVLHIETRLEVRELDFQKSTDSDQGSNSVDISSDLLEGFEVFGKQLMSPTEETVDESEWKEEDELKSSKNTIPPSTTGSRWKSILNSIAKQVSQVPLSLAVRVTSLRGTLRLHIKPPPSDQLWFAFTSMPDIDFNLESAVGEHRITNGHIALFLVSRLKAAIRDAVVLPNCGSLCLPWMIAERDDWVPKKVAPFGWVNQETISDPTVREAIISQPNGAKTKTESNSSAKTKTESTSGAKTKTESTRETSNDIESKCQKSKNSESSTESSDASPTSMKAAPGSGTLQELRTPLLGSDEPQETCKQMEEVLDSQSPSRSAISIERRDSTTTEDDSRLKRLGRRAKMLDLGKKMGEKFEEKRRHIEEKSRHFVEKMRGP